MKSNPLIDEILVEFKAPLGNHFNAYRNHCQRVFQLVMMLNEGNPNSSALSIAIAFHDLGIWTETTFDYLKPSVKLSNEYLQNKNQLDLAPEVETIILQHHKINRYQGIYWESTELVRKADLIDLTMGIISNGIKSDRYKALVKEFSYSGFHKFLVKTSIKRFFTHPLDPLPMFKW